MVFCDSKCEGAPPQVTGAAMIEVEGGGSSEVNGKYQRGHELLDDDERICPYFRDGKWKGNKVQFWVYRKTTCDGSKYWFIGYSTATGSVIHGAHRTDLYRTRNSVHSILPPKNGWYAPSKEWLVCTYTGRRSSRASKTAASSSTSSGKKRKADENDISLSIDTIRSFTNVKFSAPYLKGKPTHFQRKVLKKLSSY